MPPILLPPDFVQGSVIYWDFEPSQDHSRIVMPVLLGNRRTSAILDTGAPWCVFNPEEAATLDLDFQAFATSTPTLVIRGYPYRGWLMLDIPITLEANDGESLIVSSTVFVPDLELGQEWQLPNFLGLSGFLERIRFAVDPSTNLFYFGAIE
jgi:hypothetical protein